MGRPLDRIGGVKHLLPGPQTRQVQQIFCHGAPGDGQAISIEQVILSRYFITAGVPPTLCGLPLRTCHSV
jgi:hypothetical protein